VTGPAAGLPFESSTSPAMTVSKKRHDARCLALGANCGRVRYHGFEGDFPFMAFKATEAAYGHFEIAAFDTERFSVEQGIGNFASPGIQQPGKSAPGYIHLAGAFFLLPPLEVFQANRFGLLDEQSGLLQLIHADTGWFKIGHRRYGTYPAP